MTSRMKSAILSRTNSLRRSKFPALGKSIQDTFNNDGGYGSNEYIHKNFFDKENYHSILKCLDDGHAIGMDLIQYMQDYHDLLENFAKSLTSYSTKWKSKLKEQSTLSSYNTTKQAQLQTVSSPLKIAALIQTRCAAIQQVIDAYRTQLDRMYPSARFNTVHKHYRTDVMKRLFKSAYAPLSKASDKRDELREQEKRAESALHAAEIECENLELVATTSDNKLSKAHDRREKKQDDLESVKEKLARANDDYHRERKTYREKAAEIYQECRGIEQERLDQIREAVINFNQAIHTSDYSAEQDSIYAKLLTKIQSEQNTQIDLDFWAQTYHVDTLARSISSETTESESEHTASPKTNKSQKNDTVNLTTIQENTTQPVVETEEDQSIVDKPTSSAKGKPKKKKNTATESTTPEPSQSS